ncbi:hypothetical protein [Streptomyces sp. NPDC014734]
MREANPQVFAAAPAAELLAAPAADAFRVAGGTAGRPGTGRPPISGAAA